MWSGACVAMVSRDGFRVFAEWHYFELLERLKESEDFVDSGFWTVFNTVELTGVVLYGREGELCLCDGCGEPNALAGGASCWMNRVLVDLASKAGLELGFKKVICESGSEDVMAGIERVQETFSNVIGFEGAHVVWVNFVRVDSRGHSVPSARKSMFCFGDMMRGRRSVRDAEVGKFKRFFELCLEAFPEKHEVEGMSPLLCKFLKTDQ